MASVGNLYHQLLQDCCRRCASLRQAIAYSYEFDCYQEHRQAFFRALRQEEQLLEEFQQPHKPILVVSSRLN